MYGSPGIAYVYLVYGMYDCLNIVTDSAGRPAAVLIRAVEPLEGVPEMRRARLAWHGSRRKSAAADADALAAERSRLDGVADASLARGPGLVAAAFTIDRSMTGLDLLDAGSRLHLEDAGRSAPARDVDATPRIGIAYAGEPWTSKPWRFVDPSSPAVSGPRSRRRG
jgi:DNA-3-methyladenine glycosylase